MNYDLYQKRKKETQDKADRDASVEREQKEFHADEEEDWEDSDLEEDEGEEK